MVTDCAIQTQEADETLDFDFTSANVTNKIIMKVSLPHLIRGRHATVAGDNTTSHNKI